MAEKLRAADFVAFLKDRLARKDGYIMGAVGQDPKRLSEWYFSGQYSGARLEKARYWRQHAQRVWDCNGLAEGFYQEKTGVSINTRARYNYSDWCEKRGSGMIPPDQRVPGAAVFKKSTEIHHVGFLSEPVDAAHPEGDWYVIEAKGVMYGVVRTRLLGGGWNLWGWMSKYFSYDAPLPTPEAPDSALGSRLLKRGMQGEDVRQLQQLLLDLGYDLPLYGADGEFGGETRAALRKLQASLELNADGIYGEQTHAALMALLDQDDAAGQAQPAAKRIRVTAAKTAYVRMGPGTAYSALTIVRRGMEFDLRATAENGWRCIEINGQLAWISPKMSQEI